MLLRTEYKSKKEQILIQPNDKILAIGSCFADEMSKNFQSHNWNILTNPHGILFNPASILTCIQDIENSKIYTNKEIFNWEGLFRSFNHHGAFSATNIDTFLAQINDSISQARTFAQNANWCIISLGTAWVYRYLSTNEIVANCHKIQQSSFQHELLPSSLIESMLKSMVDALLSLNPEMRIIFTVSPVRYLKDGFVENSRSKAHLLHALHQVLDNNPEVKYFPSFEIFLDDLRDYRFVAEDLVHPNKLAIDYIWEKFIETYFSSDSMAYAKEMKKWYSMKNHRILHAETDAHKDFIKKLENYTEELKSKYPFAVFV